jgi:hypothetical protein
VHKSQRTCPGWPKAIEEGFLTWFVRLQQLNEEQERVKAQICDKKAGRSPYGQKSLWEVLKMKEKQ